VSLGVLLMSFLQDNDPEFIKSRFDSIGVAYQPEAMGITWDDVRQGSGFMPEVLAQGGQPLVHRRGPPSHHRLLPGKVQAWLAASVSAGAMGADRGRRAPGRFLW